MTDADYENGSLQEWAARHEEDVYTFVLHVALPLGTSIWAFTEAARLFESWWSPVLVLIAAGTLFYAFNRFLNLTADHVCTRIEDGDSDGL